MDALRLDNLTRNFGGLRAIDRVSLNVAPGERRAIIGPNGAGKTTLFNLISGELLPDAGQVYLAGEAVTRLPAHSRAQRGLARTFQRNNLFSNLSVFENVRLAVQLHTGVSHRALRPAHSYRTVNEKAEELLMQLGLRGEKAAPARQLSHGAQRQLELAIALATEPRLLLLDEPTAGMSPSETAHIVNQLKALPSDLTLLLIEHDMDVVFSVANRVTALHYGQVIADGPAAEVQNDPRVLEIYLGEEQVKSRRQALGTEY